MSANLFATIPSNAPLSFLSYSEGAEILTHIIGGIPVLAFAGVLIVYALKMKINLVLRLSAFAIAYFVAFYNVGEPRLWKPTICG